MVHAAGPFVGSYLVYVACYVIASEVALSVLLQSGYHIYQGVASMLLLSSTFFIFALYYARTRRALPIMLAHLCADVTAVVAARQ